MCGYAARVTAARVWHTTGIRTSKRFRVEAHTTPLRKVVPPWHPPTKSFKSPSQSQVWLPSSSILWRWSGRRDGLGSPAPYQSHLFMMIVGVYATLGIFLLNAARDPQANLSLIWFTAISSLVHSAVMAVQSFSHGHHHMGHLLGDVPALLILGVVLVVLLLASGIKQPAHDQARLLTNRGLARRP